MKLLIAVNMPVITVKSLKIHFLLQRICVGIYFFIKLHMLYTLKYQGPLSLMMNFISVELYFTFQSRHISFESYLIQVTSCFNN